ncbi:MAG: hypothetical protein GXP25_10680 [Planctomycetes bacterium]|nr:hypothetical protein [Planctomycetota bacterium]
MAKVKNPQEFFEVFKGADAGEQETEKPPAPQEEASSAPMPKPAAVPQTPRVKYAEVAVTPGTITIAFSHTGLVLAMSLLALLLIVSFCLGIRYARRPGKVPHEVTAEGTVPALAAKAEERSLDSVPALDMTPSSKAASRPAPAPTAEKPGAPGRSGKMYCLQLISAIPKKKAAEIAKTLSVNWDTEIVRTGKTYGVRIGYWSSPNETAARHARSYFEKQKEFKGCYFIKLER